MRRLIILGLVTAVGVGSMAVAAAYQPPAGQQPKERKVEVEKLRDNLYVLRGGGGNTGVFIGSTGVVVVDTKNPGWGQPILEAIQKLTPKPVTTIINTHTHGDHVSGNVEFAENVDIIVHENTRANMARMASPPGMGRGEPPKQTIFQANQGKGLPKRAFKDKLTVGTGADRIDLYYFGRGHTNGDTFVFFPALRVMHAGDMFAGKGIPIIDTNNGGSGVEYGETLAKAAAAAANIDSVITGHSTIMTVADLKEFAEFNREFAKAVLDAKKAGRTIDEIAASWTVPAKFTGYATPDPKRLRFNVQAVFDESK